MANRLYILVCRARRNVLKHIRGYVAELVDPTGDDALDDTAQPTPIAYVNDAGGGWQRPVISAPIPALGGERLCRWGIRHSQTTPETRQALSQIASTFPQLVRVFPQQGTVTDGEFVPSEDEAECWARVRATIGWIDRPAPQPAGIT